MTNSLARRDLTEKQVDLALAIADGAPIDRAWEMAGYASKRAAEDALRNPAVILALEVEMRRRLAEEAAPAAYAFLLEVVRSPKYGERVRVDAAKTLLDRSGYAAPKTAARQPGDKDMQDMTPDELHRFIERLEGELADRATVIQPPDGIDLFEMLE